MKTRKFKTYYDDRVDDAKTNNGASMTDPQYLGECDVNTILRNFERTGAIPPNMQKAPGAYADVSGITDYGELMNKYIEATNAFSDLPAEIRERFGNNPRSFYDFVNNEENNEELVRLGLAHFRAPVEIPCVRIVSEVTSDKKEE